MFHITNGPSRADVAKANKRKYEKIKADPDLLALHEESVRKYKKLRSELMSESEKSVFNAEEAERASEYRATRTPEQHAEIKRKNRELMAADRKARPDFYKAKDKAKLKKRFSDPIKLEAERQRCREKNQRNRDKQKGITVITRPKSIKKQTNVVGSCTVCLCENYSKVYEICRGCRGTEKRIKKQETEVLNFFESNDMFPSLADRKGPCGSSDNRRRVDALFFSGNETRNIVILEIDENQHNNRTPECEMTRMSEIRDQYVGRGIICIRYHPERDDSWATSFNCITQESKATALMAVCTALMEPCITSKTGYEQRYIGYNKARIEQLNTTYTKMQTEQMLIYTK